MQRDSDWQADLERYPARPFLQEQSIWAIWIYRFGRRISARQNGIFKSVAMKLFWLAYRLIETATGISLPISAKIGPGLRIWHFGNVIVHADAVIGANCTMRHGITVGNRHPHGPVPQIGDNADIGAYAQILGGVKIGNNCRIGAMSVVLIDVPDGATAVGIPARLIEDKRERNSDG
jgi:serine O-acetyltransferase